MAGLELSTRLPSAHDEERWLLRGDPRVAWIFSEGKVPFLAAMARAVQSWLGFSHPRVVRAHHVSWLAGQLVCEIDDDRGPTLAEASEQLADRPDDRDRWVVAQIIGIARGLAAMAAHVGAPYVRYRIEPSDLFVDISGRACLRAPILDTKRRAFASMIDVDAPLPTADDVAWLTPEALRGDVRTPACNVFALATNLVFALTGRAPFVGDSAFAMLEAIITALPRTLPTRLAGLDAVLSRALAKNPAGRFATPGDLADALEACVPDAADYGAVLSDLIADWWPIALTRSSV